MYSDGVQSVIVGRVNTTKPITMESVLAVQVDIMELTKSSKGD